MKGKYVGLRVGAEVIKVRLKAAGEEQQVQ